MLFNNLLKPRVVQLGELGQIMDIGNDIAEYLFQRQEVVIGGWRSRSTAAFAPTTGRLVQSRDNVIHVDLALLDALNNFLALTLLESKDLVQLALEQRDKVLLVVFGPVAAGGLGASRSGLGDKISFECLFELFVGDVVGMILPDH